MINMRHNIITCVYNFFVILGGFKHKKGAINLSESENCKINTIICVIDLKTTVTI